MIFFCIHSSVRVRTASAQDGLGVVGRGVGGFAGGEDGGEVGVLRRGAMVGQGLERMSMEAMRGWKVRAKAKAVYSARCQWPHFQKWNRMRTCCGGTHVHMNALKASSDERFKGQLCPQLQIIRSLTKPLSKWYHFADLHVTYEDTLGLASFRFAKLTIVMLALGLTILATTSPAAATTTTRGLLISVPMMDTNVVHLDPCQQLSTCQGPLSEYPSIRLLHCNPLH